MRFKCLLFCLLIFVSKGYGQSEHYVGFTAGGNTSSVFFNHLAFRTGVSTALHSGIQAGFTYKHFSPLKTGVLNTGLQVSLNYSQKGYQQKLDETFNRPNITTTLNYLEIPFSAVIYFGKKKTKFFVTPGIYMEVLIDSEVKNVPEDDDESRDFINFGNSNIFPFDENKDNTIGAGGRLEGGIMRDFSFGTLQLAGNFSYSITNILDFESRSSGIPDVSNNFSIGITVGYFFSFGKLKTIR